ncbi:MAG: FGGY-family carbohydrate kinase [Thermotogae bacterium]|nr:FGGY-family carbohydrate kinase [Thermotogota bacterium]
MKDLILTIDCGTQSLRTALFDPKGRMLRFERIEYPPYMSPKPGWAEQDPELYWRSIVEAVRRMVESEFKDRIAGITITTQRATTVVVDKDGKPLRPAILWLDQRKARFDVSLGFMRSVLYSLVGMLEAVKMVQMEGKMNWIRQNEPEIWKKTGKILLLSGYLNFKLTGEFNDSVASQIGYIPFDYRRRRWADPKDIKSIIFPVDRDKLPNLVEPPNPLGELSKKSADELGLGPGIPVIASGSDKGCETLGLGVLDEESASLSFGTTATVQVMTKKYFEPLKFIPPYPAVIPGYYNPEVEIFRGFWLVRWFKEEFAGHDVDRANELGIQVEELLNNHLDEVPPGSLGLIVQPYWTPGLKMPEARGAMIGFGSFHGKYHVYRAIIEGINYALLEGLRRIERRGKMKIKRVMVAGGGSKSREICGITANIFGLPVHRPKNPEVASLGAAVVASVGLRFHRGFREAVEDMVRYEEVVEPEERIHREYREIFEKVYTKIYPKLRGLYSKLKRIVKD